MGISEELKKKMDEAIREMIETGLEKKLINGLAYFVVSTEHLDGMPVHKKKVGEKTYHLYHVMDK